MGRPTGGGLPTPASAHNHAGFSKLCTHNSSLHLNRQPTRLVRVTRQHAEKEVLYSRSKAGLCFVTENDHREGERAGVCCGRELESPVPRGHSHSCHQGSLGQPSKCHITSTCRFQDRSAEILKLPNSFMDHRRGQLNRTI